MQGISDHKSVSQGREARLDSTLSYQGSVHDDSAAQRFGFQRAIVPGVYPYSFMTQMVMETWGLAWLTHGTISSRSRRPLYNGDRVLVTADPIAPLDKGNEVALRVTNNEGEDAAVAHATLPNAPPPRIDLADFPVSPCPPSPIPIGAGEMKPGMRLSSLTEVVTDDYFRQSLLDFGETNDAVIAGRTIHPGLLLRLSFRHSAASYKTPSPGIYVSSEAQFYSLLKVGETVTSSAVVTAAYERKGHHYVEVDQLLIAEGTRPVVRFHRCSIYATRVSA